MERLSGCPLIKHLALAYRRPDDCSDLILVKLNLLGGDDNHIGWKVDSKQSKINLSSQPSPSIWNGHDDKQVDITVDVSRPSRMGTKKYDFLRMESFHDARDYFIEDFLTGHILAARIAITVETSNFLQDRIQSGCDVSKENQTCAERRLAC